MILIRTIVGLVFLLEGVLKFVRPDALGAGRFAAIGLPFPNVLAPLVGGIEIGVRRRHPAELLCRRCRASSLLVVIFTALITTKIPIMLGRPLGPFTLEKLNNYGWLSSSTRRAPI